MDWLKMLHIRSIDYLLRKISSSEVDDEDVDSISVSEEQRLITSQLDDLHLTVCTNYYNEGDGATKRRRPRYLADLLRRELRGCRRSRHNNSTTAAQNRFSFIQTTTLSFITFFLLQRWLFTFSLY